ncbi:3-isopropylmalate dehydrogenase [Bacillus sp. HMF5848]|uniref:3-isopropylmalate dehydrogenase n=1 Tax=Bacillus sp. HMF5848 TaxID=2495421 RepID=UPI00163B4A10|nr:3-isopropylmalate dehydrogenase [Bacillus sp. HMF5848]
MNKSIAVLAGDGIGPEITRGAIEVLKVVGERYGHKFEFHQGLIGGAAIDQTGTPLPEETLNICKKSDAILLGAVGGPKWDKNQSHLRPETGLLQLRKKLELYANLRPVQVFKSLRDASPIRADLIQDVDLMIVRELTGGLYFGTPKGRSIQNGVETAVDTLFYEKSEMERIVKKAFELAQSRSKKVTSVDKANVLESSRMWREVAENVSKEFPDVKLEHMLVDNAAMQLIRDPKQFDVVVTENMFGDILSDEASMLTGSLGMLPSASLSMSGLHLYEPIHGSAPDIAGAGKANPIATILSVAMMLRMSFNMDKEAEAVERAVNDVLDAGFRTADIADGEKCITTNEMIHEIKAEIAGTGMISSIMAIYA